MADLLARFKLDYWYHAFVALGAAGVIASLTVETKGIANADALFLSLGIFLIGTGEWLNHPLQTTLTSPGLYGRGAGKITGHPRRNKPHGVAMVILGIASAAPALYHIAVQR